MAINANDMNDFCMDKLIAYAQGDYKDEMESPKTMKVLADAMKEYLEANLEVTYAWVATRPSDGSPDPVTSYKGTVKFTSFNLDRPMTLNPGLSGKIVASVATGVITAPSGFSVSPGSFTPMPLTLPQGGSFSDAMLNNIFKPVCNWIKTCMPGASMAGSHAAYVGAGTMVNIS